MIYKLNNFFKTGFDYTDYKMLALLFRVNPSSITDPNVLSINGLIYNDTNIPTLPDNNEYYIISGTGENAIIELVMSKLYDEMYTSTFNGGLTAKIVYNNNIWYVLLCEVYTTGAIKWSSINGGIKNSSGTNVAIDVDITGFNSGEPNLKDVALFGYSLYPNCAGSVIRVGSIPLS